MKRKSILSRYPSTLGLFIALCVVPIPSLHAQAASTNMVQLTLAGKIDSKTAKVGDPVVTKTVYPMELGGVSFHSESKIVGKITAVSAEPASVTIQLDSLQ